MDQEHQTFQTITPSEPIVAHVAAKLLMETHAGQEQLSPPAILF